MSTTIYSTSSVFYKLPKELICRNNTSSNTNHFIYREIHTKPIIKTFVRERIKQALLDVYKVSKEQHMKRFNSGSKLLIVEDMFPSELVNPGKHRKEQQERSCQNTKTTKTTKLKEPIQHKKRRNREQSQSRVFGNY